VSNVVFHIRERRYAEGVHEYGAEEDIWAQKGRNKRGRKLHNEDLSVLYLSPNIIQVMR